MHGKARKILSLVLSFCFLFQQASFAQVAAELNLGSYFSKVGSSLTQEKFRPLHLRYFSYDNASDNFKVLLDKGSLKEVGDTQAKEATKDLLSYFLVGVSLPDSLFWVNLRPDAQDQIIDPALEQTDLGKIMLEADLQLKKDTAALTSPRTTEGKAYWAKLYKKAAELYGNDNTSIPTLTRPWIVPGEVIVRETKDSAYVYKAGLKVMLEQDYLKDSSVYNFPDARSKALNEYSSQLIRELIIPKLTRDVNSAKRYSALRQVYYSLILSRWFKMRFTGKEGTYSKLINTANLANLTSAQSWSKSTYFNAYKKSFADGEYNISEPVSTPTGQVIRTYFSGGIQIGTGAINTQNGINSTGSRLVSGMGIAIDGNAVNSKLTAGSPIGVPKVTGMLGISTFDSRAAKTIEFKVTLDLDGASYSGLSRIPAGASTGTREVWINPDFVKTTNEIVIPNLYKAIAAGEVNITSQKSLANWLKALDLKLGGSGRLDKIGGNVVLAICWGFADAVANAKHVSLYKYWEGEYGEGSAYYSPEATYNILNAGAHGSATTKVDTQETQFAFLGELTAVQQNELAAAVNKGMKSYLKKKGLVTTNGDEGGFSPEATSNMQYVRYLVDSVDGLNDARLKWGKKIAVAFDFASTGFFKNGSYYLRGELDPVDLSKGLGQAGQAYFKKLVDKGVLRSTTIGEKVIGVQHNDEWMPDEPGVRLEKREWLAYVQYMLLVAPAWSVEDVCAENDWASIREMTRLLEEDRDFYEARAQEHQETGFYNGRRVWHLGDDSITSNPDYARLALVGSEDMESFTRIDDKLIRVNRNDAVINLEELGASLIDGKYVVEPHTLNAFLLKFNQIGTPEDTFEAAKQALKRGALVSFSHRSGSAGDWQFIHGAYTATTFTHNVSTNPSILPELKNVLPRVNIKAGNSTRERMLVYHETRAKVERSIGLVQSKLIAPEDIASSPLTQASSPLRLTSGDVIGDLTKLTGSLKGVVEYDLVNGRAKVVAGKEEAFKANLPNLIYNICVNQNSDIVEAIEWMLLEVGPSFGVIPASSHELYQAFGAKDYYKKSSLLKINQRALVPYLIQAMFDVSKEENAAMLAQVALSELVYIVNSDPRKVPSLQVAIAMLNGYKGPIFTSLDHLQIKKADYVKDRVATMKKAAGQLKKQRFGGVHNADTDTSTLALTPAENPDIYEQQRPNFENAFLLIIYNQLLEAIHGLPVAPANGEVGEVGTEPVTSDELRQYLTGFRNTMNAFENLSLDEKIAWIEDQNKIFDFNDSEMAKIKELIKSGIQFHGLSAMSCQVGSAHGGVKQKGKPWKRIAGATIKVALVQELSQVCQEFGLAGLIVHGASSLPDATLERLTENGAVAVHLATYLHDIVFNSPDFPTDLILKVFSLIEQRNAKLYQNKIEVVDEGNIIDGQQQYKKVTLGEIMAGIRDTINAGQKLTQDQREQVAWIIYEARGKGITKEEVAAGTGLWSIAALEKDMLDLPEETLDRLYQVVKDQIKKYVGQLGAAGTAKMIEGMKFPTPPSRSIPNSFKQALDAQGAASPLTLQEQLDNAIRVEQRYRKLFEQSLGKKYGDDVKMATAERQRLSDLIAKQNTQSSAASPLKDGVGGIDFRAIKASFQPMGSFKNLKLDLPKLSRAALDKINLETEMRQMRQMVEKGIAPSGTRIKELIAACVQKGKLDAYSDSLLLCLVDICKMQEENVTETSTELKEALVLLDVRG